VKANRRLIITNNKGIASPSLAEHAITMVMMLERRMQIYINNQARRKWAWGAVPQGKIRELKGRTLLVVGLGGIGTQVALRAHALGMKVIATRNSSHQGPDYVDYVGLPDELLGLTARADYIVNALPLTPDTTGLFDAKFFKAMKNDAFFVTVGRGKSVVTRDLVAALRAGELAGAGLDVTDPEPLPPDNPLWGMKNVIITPHTGGITADAGARRIVLLRENLRRYVNGEPLLNLVDKKKGY
jgi:phosphoglycerate dehydrogenase-like enzyme